MSIPHLFRCPISLDIFTDPVTLCTGQTYDRPCIERWLADGHSTCPVTMQRLHDTALVPNHTLRHLIQRWLAVDDHRLGPPEPAARESSAATADTELSLAALKQCLQSDATRVGAKVEALKKVRALSSESDVGRACLIQLGFFHVLLQLLFQSPLALECHSELTELTLDCTLSLLPSHSTQLDSLNMLKKDPNMASFVLLLEQGNAKVKASLCRLLETIATSRATQELAVAVGRTRRVLQTLVLLLHDKADMRTSEAPVRAVAAICSIEANRANAIREGAIPGLIKHLSWASCKGGVALRALATMEVLLGSEAGKKAMAKASSGVQVLVRHVFMMSSSNEGSEHAIAALLAVVRDSARARSEAMAAGVVTQLLLLLQSQCSSRAKAKARALLKLLRSM